MLKVSKWFKISQKGMIMLMMEVKGSFVEEKSSHKIMSCCQFMMEELILGKINEIMQI